MNNEMILNYVCEICGREDVVTLLIDTVILFARIYELLENYRIANLKANILTKASQI
jgi:hypothetical protein